MRRSTLACFSGMAGLLAVTSSGCEDWKHVLDGIDLPDTGGGTKPGTGTAGASGGGGKCDATMGPKGETCKTCWDENGRIIHQECAGPVSTGSGGSTGTTPQMCTKLEDGGPGSCKDASTWKRYGSDACLAQNLTLTDYALGPACDGGYQSVTYVCCSPATPTPPPSTPPGQMCIRIQQGDATSCKDQGTWKQSGYEACLLQKMNLTDYALGPVCDGGYQSATFVCCYTPPTPPPPPPAPPTMCTKIQDGGPTSCKDLGTWKQYGSDACRAQNLILTDYAPGESCDNGNYRTVTYVCCAQTPPVETPPIKCGESTDASGRPCKVCYDVNGKVVSGDCGTATAPMDDVMTPPISCRALTNNDGSQCKLCINADGTVAYTDCASAPPAN
jgi:hypothetical protein